MKVSDREVTLDSVTTGQQVLKVHGIFCIIPKGMKVVEMWPTTPYLLGSMTPAYTWGDKIRVNPDIFALVGIDLLIEECVHGFQYRRMRSGFFPTYIWHIILDIFRKRREVSLHNANLMEREAMGLARKIFNEFDYNNKVMDIEKEIKKRTGWV